MLPIDSLVNGTLDDAIGYLAGRASVVRGGGRTLAEKRAAAVSDVLTSLGDSVQTNPILGKALLGGGLGAALGAGQHAFMPEEPGRKKSSLASKMLLGGMGGAAVGGGLGAAQHFWPGAGGGSATSEGAAGAPTSGKGTFELGGKKWKVDPALLKEKPELLSKVHELSSGPLYETLPGKAWNFITNNPFAPTTTPYVLPTAVADVALHHEGLRLGQRNWAAPIGKPVEWAGQASRNVADLFRGRKAPVGTNPLEVAGKAVTGWGERAMNQGWFPGMIDPRHSRNIEHMRKGIKADLAAKDGGAAHVKELAEHIDRGQPISGGVSYGGKAPIPGQSGKDVLQQLAKNPGQSVEASVMKDKMMSVNNMEATLSARGLTPDQAREGAQYIHEWAHADPAARAALVRPTALNAARDLEMEVKSRVGERMMPTPTAQKIEPELRGNWAAGGAKADADAIAASARYKPHAPPEAHVFRSGPLGGDRVLRGSALRGSRLAKRLGLYLGVPAAEWGLRSYGRDIAKSRTLQEIMAEAKANRQIREVK